MKKTFYSNGKLLITGEYLVLDGATALALPTKFGQNLNIEEGSDEKIHWKSYDADGTVWFEDVILFSEIKAPTSPETASVKNTLIKILHEAFIMNPDFITKGKGYSISTQLSFPRKWGLGTSSTLINNITQWLQIDAFELLNNSFGGSGYDIACAQNNTPILYRLENEKPIVEQIAFNPDFKQHLYFVYLNQKQSSKTAIANYRKNNTAHLDKNIAKIDALTAEILKAKTLPEFEHAITKHETAMSHILEVSTVKEALFPDFKGEIKSLGAWGGDFILAISTENPTPYFNNKGYAIVLSYEEMILDIY